MSSVTFPAVIWSKQDATIDTSGSDVTPSVAIDAFGNIYMAYSTTGIISGQNQIAVYQLDPSGNVNWSYNGLLSGALGVNIDANNTNPSIQVGPDTSPVVCYTTDFGGVLNPVICKLDNSGVLVWAASATTVTAAPEHIQPIWTTGADNTNVSIAITISNDVLVSFQTTGSVIGGPETVGAHYGVPGFTDTVVSKLNGGGGSVAWVKQQATFNTVGNDSAPTVTSDSSGYSYVAYYTDTSPAGCYTTIHIYSQYPDGGLMTFPEDYNMPTMTRNNTNPQIVYTNGSLYVNYISDSTGSPHITFMTFLAGDTTVAPWGPLIPVTPESTDFYAPMTADTSGNIYVTYSKNNVTTDSSGILTLNVEVWLTKIAPSGAIEWSRSLDTLTGSGTNPASPGIAITDTNVFSVFSLTGGISGETPVGSSDIAVVCLGEITTPSAPLNVALVDTQLGKSLTLSWAEPTSDGGGPILGYIATLTDSSNVVVSASVSSSTYTYVFTGLTNGEPYTATVSAVNEAGPGTSQAAALQPINPTGPPAAPVIGKVTAALNQLTVAWSDSSDTGGLPLTGYTVYLFDALTNSQITTADVSAGHYAYTFMSSISQGGTYYCEVTASNSLGEGANSDSSAPIQPYPFYPCLLAGTRVLTNRGYKPVDQLDLSAGDLITTSDGRAVPFTVHTYVATACSSRRPLFIRAGYLGDGLPLAGIGISPGHAIRVGENAWIMPGELRGGGICYAPIAVGERFTYYHVELPNYLTDHLMCEGVVIESFSGRQAAGTSYRTVGGKMLHGYTIPVYARAGGGDTAPEDTDAKVAAAPRRLQTWAYRWRRRASY